MITRLMIQSGLWRSIWSGQRESDHLPIDCQSLFSARDGGDFLCQVSVKDPHIEVSRLGCHCVYFSCPEEECESFTQGQRDRVTKTPRIQVNWSHRGISSQLVFNQVVWVVAMNLNDQKDGKSMSYEKFDPRLPVVILSPWDLLNLFDRFWGWARTQGPEAKDPFS